ncbi:6-hydroxy-d-nicotine oxidase [Podospora aff. communis PSN243]|uniref:6-hydroxy-d-nicotine oxidase n=1 Tax=Podospora aff. communis PSN243 TaxID=3040156 RepID=A0AAV9GWH0_9PEZI|nr:6-hydroxy-d-nicotine oxidase [Podospora aff. communis PSN243]
MHPLILLSLATLAAAKLRGKTPKFDLLAPHLSPSAQIILPSSPSFSNYTHQNLRSHPPSYAAIVAVATESDVSASIRFANKHSIPFSAKVSGHGTWAGLGDIKNGMNIWMRELNSVTLSKDGKEAVVGGGAMVDEVVKYLWKEGKQTATALGQCIGITGSGIGGGLGPLMGVYGLGLDQFLGFRVVLANGTVVVASEEENQGLFWGMRGAGHNFGVVTEARVRVYDKKGADAWVYRQLVFGGEKVEEIFEAINDKLEAQPGHLSHDVSIYQGGDGVVVDLRVFSNGFGAAELDSYVERFVGLGPSGNSTTLKTDYLGLIREMGYEAPEGGCGPPTGSFGSVFGVGVTKHVPSAMRKLYDLFDELTTSVPELGGSYIFIEGYGTEAVRKVPAVSSAFAHRHIRAWPNAVLAYRAEKINSTLETTVKAWGEKLRAAMLEGQERQESYVNYAVEQESLNALYGYNDWRLKKLRHLKQVLDPKGRYSFFAPVR